MYCSCQQRPTAMFTPPATAPAPVHALPIPGDSPLRAPASVKNRMPMAFRPFHLVPSARQHRVQRVPADNTSPVPATHHPTPDLKGLSVASLEHLLREDMQQVCTPLPAAYIRDNPPPWMSLKHAQKALAAYDAAAEAKQQPIRQPKHAVVLELLSRPGYWNSGIAETAIPLMPRTDAWAPGRALRIVDCESGAIHLFRDGEEQHFDPSKPDDLLPEPELDEIIVMRDKQHYTLIDPGQEDVVVQVPSNGDCFFSCISLALGANRSKLAERNLELRQSLARLLAAKPPLMEFMATDPPPSA